MGIRWLAYGSLTLASAYQADEADQRSGKQDLPPRSRLIRRAVIFVYPVDDVVRIRTGEQGREALMYNGDIDTR